MCHDLCLRKLTQEVQQETESKVSKNEPFIDTKRVNLKHRKDEKVLKKTTFKPRNLKLMNPRGLLLTACMPLLYPWAVNPWLVRSHIINTNRTLSLHSLFPSAEPQAVRGRPSEGGRRINWLGPRPSVQILGAS